VQKRYFRRGATVASGANTGNYFYALDHLGSIHELTDSAGTLRARYDYDPYGQRTKLSGDLGTDFGFTGFYRHDATGLDLAVYRAYDTETGRWISRDPIEESGGINLFSYATNNPVTDLDALGLSDTETDIQWGIGKIFSWIRSRLAPEALNAPYDVAEPIANFGQNLGERNERQQLQDKNALAGAKSEEEQLLVLRQQMNPGRNLQRGTELLKQASVDTAQDWLLDFLPPSLRHRLLGSLRPKAPSCQPNINVPVNQPATGFVSGPAGTSYFIPGVGFTTTR
jgi:RHS repeat-associated protein